MAGPGNILIKIGASAGQAIAELGTVNKSLGETMTTSEKVGAGLHKAMVPATIALGALAAGAIAAGKAAMEDAAGHDHLVSAVERTTHATEAQAEATDAWIEKLTLATGVSDDSLRPAMERLTTATGSVSESQKLMSAALDISAATGKDVVTVSAAIAKAHEGQTSSLARLVPGLSEASRKSKDFSTIMAEIADKTGGAMADKTATASGQLAIFSNSLQETKESLGAGLLPILQAVLPVLNSFATFASQNTTAIQILAAAIGVLASGIVLANVAMKAYAAAQVIVKIATTAWTAAQWLLNAALDANPIGAITLLIVALGAALVLAYQHSATFRAIVQAALAAVESAARSVAGAFQSLLSAASSAFSWIVAHWQIGLFALGPIGAAIYAIVTNFDRLKSAASATFDAIASTISGITSAIEGVIGAVERLIDALGHIHVPHISIPNPFSLAAPLSPSGVSRSSPRAGAPGYAGAGGVTVNVYGAVDPEGTARAIRRILTDSDRRRGR